MKLLLAELAKMSAEKQKETLNDLIKESLKPPSTEMISSLREKIFAYETEAGMTTEELKNKLQSNSLSETMIHVEWLMLDNLLRSIEKLIM